MNISIKTPISLLCALTFALLAIQSAFAAKIEEDGWYVGAFGGFGFPQTLNSSVEYGTISGSPDITVSGPLRYKSAGGQAGTQLGYKFGSIRVEGQFFWAHSGLKRATLNGVPSNEFPNRDVSGFANIYAGMGNIFYDFYNFADETREMVVVPYIGAGAGYAQIQQRINVTGPNSNNLRGRLNPKDCQFAYQAIVGTSIYLDSFTSLTVDYRFFSTTKLDTFDASFRYHSVNFGINFILDNFFA